MSEANPAWRLFDPTDPTPVDRPDFEEDGLFALVCSEAGLTEGWGHEIARATVRAVAGSGRPTLLCDLALEGPPLVDFPPSEGVTDVVRYGASLDRVTLDWEGIQYVGPGTIDGNPQEVLAEPTMVSAMEARRASSGGVAFFFVPADLPGAEELTVGVGRALWIGREDESLPDWLEGDTVRLLEGIGPGAAVSGAEVDEVAPEVEPELEVETEPELETALEAAHEIETEPETGPEVEIVSASDPGTEVFAPTEGDSFDDVLDEHIDDVPFEAAYAAGEEGSPSGDSPAVERESVPVGEDVGEGIPVEIETGARGEFEEVEISLDEDDFAPGHDDQELDAVQDEAPGEPEMESVASADDPDVPIDAASGLEIEPGWPDFMEPLVVSAPGEIDPLDAAEKDRPKAPSDFDFGVEVEAADVIADPTDTALEPGAFTASGSGTPEGESLDDFEPHLDLDADLESDAPDPWQGTGTFGPDRALPDGKSGSPDHGAATSSAREDEHPQRGVTDDARSQDEQPLPWEEKPAAKRGAPAPVADVTRTVTRAPRPRGFLYVLFLLFLLTITVLAWAGYIDLPFVDWFQGDTP